MVGELSRPAARVLVYKFNSGEFSACRWPTVRMLIERGYLEEFGKRLVVTSKGRDFAFAHHMEV